MQTPTPYAPAEALPIVRREASHNGESLTESLQSGSGGLSRSWGRAVHRREPVHGMPDPAATKPTPENLIEVMRLSPEWFATLRKGEILPYRFLFGSRNVKVRSIQRDH